MFDAPAWVGKLILFVLAGIALFGVISLVWCGPGS